MNKKELRESYDPEELYRVITELCHGGLAFTIWQNCKDKSRNEDSKLIIPGVISQHKLIQNKLHLEFSIKANSKIHSKSKIFVFSPELKLLLKGKITAISPTKLRVIVDNKFYLKEKRDLARIKLEQKEMNALIGRKLELKNRFKEEEVELKDISDGGFSFYITSSRAIFFQINSTINLKSIGDVLFDTELVGKVSHVTPLKNNSKIDNTYLQIGVKLETLYPRIDTVIQIAKMKKSELKGSDLPDIS